MCLDNKNISLKGQKQIEPCDLITINNGCAELIHIKISTRSASLSHLFNQGLNSVELLRLNDEARESLKNLINDEFNSAIDSQKFSVIYGIISAKDKINKSDNLPIFSRISLKRTVNALKLMGVQVSVVFIKDNVDRKKNNDSNEKS